MLVHPTEILDAARERAYAIGAFNTYNLEITQAIIRAAEAKSAPVIIQTGASAFDYAGLTSLAALVLAAADEARVPVVVHLDHARDIGTVSACLRHGYKSVMFDGSRLPFQENVERTREAAELAHSEGALLEAELGAVAGIEDGSASIERGDSLPFTDPDEAAQFVERTGADVLAVAIGNVHGFYKGEPKLDFERLDAIRHATDVLLALHGASGLPDDAVRQAIQLGITKINVNTDMRKALFDSLTHSLAGPQPGYNLPALMEPAMLAVQTVVEEKLRLFGAAGQAE